MQIPSNTTYRFEPSRPLPGDGSCVRCHAPVATFSAKTTASEVDYCPDCYDDDPGDDVTDAAALAG